MRRGKLGRAPSTLLLTGLESTSGRPYDRVKAKLDGRPHQI